jgi:tetratricopeptide (TPR) repeat protein
MFKLKTNIKLTKLAAHLFLFVCILLSPAVLEAQPAAEDSYEKEFFEKLYSIASSPSEDTSKKIESITAGLKSLPVSNETNAKIIQRLFIEADQTAELDLQKAGIFWKAAELIAAQSNDRSALANAVYYRANTLAALDKYREALIEYQRAVEVFKDNPATTDQEKSVVCQIYLAAGETAGDIDENETAREFFEKGWKILASVKDWRKSKLFVPVARDLLLGWGNEGRQSGDYSLAAEKFSEVLSLTEDDDFRRAEVLWELGKLKRDTGDFAAGATDFNEAIKLLDKTSKWNENERLNLQGNLYNSLGLLMLEQRFTKGAEQNLDQALALARLLKDSHLEGTVLRNLSIAARQRRDHQTARTRALAAFEIAARTDLNDLNISANNILASLAQNSNDHQEAIERLQKSVALAEKSRNVLRLIESKWRLGESLFALQKYEEAKKLVQESLSVAQKNQWSNLIYLSATLVGRTHVKDGNLSAAEAMFELAIREIEQKRRQVAGADIEKVSFMGDKATAYHELLKLQVETGDTKRALVTAEKLKSRVLEDKVGGRKKIESNSNLLSLSVPEETAVVSYTVTDEACFAFVFRPQGTQPKIFVIAQGEKTLTEKIKWFRAGLIKFEPTFKLQARELYALLLKDLEPEIGYAKNLVIIPSCGDD